MRLLLCAALATFATCGDTVSADRNDRKPSPPREASFRTITPPSVEEARAQAAAWLKPIRDDEAAWEAFARIWDSERPVLDRVAATLALGDANAARLLYEAKYGEPPVELPLMLTDKRQPVYFRANLALAYARALTRRKVYEEALETLHVIDVDAVVDPAAFYFFRAVCAYELMWKDVAEASIVCLEDVEDVPARYRAVADRMRGDMETWEEKDLAWVARRMQDVTRRLALNRGGKRTQKLQKEVLVRLDEMIKEIENNQKQDSGPLPIGADDH